MIPTNSNDARHKAMLIRTLIGIADNPMLSASLRFKGGTCAAMSGFLDRFSVDLDFDIVPKASPGAVQIQFYTLFAHLGFIVKQQSKATSFFVVTYPSPPGERNEMKVSAINEIWKANQYELRYLAEIDRALLCQTKATMVANKLVAPLDRYKKYKTIAGRDAYDIHYFLSHRYGYIPEIITERWKKNPVDFFVELQAFLQKHLTQTIIDQDLNTLLLNDIFRSIRLSLKQEIISLLEIEKKRWENV